MSSIRARIQALASGQLTILALTLAALATFSVRYSLRTDAVNEVSEKEHQAQLAEQVQLAAAARSTAAAYNDSANERTAALALFRPNDTDIHKVYGELIAHYHSMRDLELNSARSADELARWYQSRGLVALRQAQDHRRFLGTLGFLAAVLLYIVAFAMSWIWFAPRDHDNVAA